MAGVALLSVAAVAGSAMTNESCAAYEYICRRIPNRNPTLQREGTGKNQVRVTPPHLTESQYHVSPQSCSGQLPVLLAPLSMQTPPKQRSEEAKILDEEQPEQEKEDVLRAMLFVAEDEIRAKEVQVELMQQMLVTTEQEIGSKDDRIGELVNENTKLRDELAKFAQLFDRCLSKSEGPRGSLSSMATPPKPAAAGSASSSQSADAPPQPPQPHAEAGDGSSGPAAAAKPSHHADRAGESRAGERAAPREPLESRAVDDAALLQEASFDE